jgi:hypothetical protein
MFCHPFLTSTLTVLATDLYLSSFFHSHLFSTLSTVQPFIMRPRTILLFSPLLSPCTAQASPSTDMRPDELYSGALNIRNRSDFLRDSCPGSPLTCH